MKLRLRVLLYGGLVFVLLSALILLAIDNHAVLIGQGDGIIFNRYIEIIILVEGLLLLLALFGYKLVRQVFGPLELLQETTQLLSEQEFATRLRRVGHPEMDRLIGIYNDMTEILRQQRIHAREQEYFLEKVLRGTPTGIITFDFEGNIEQVNPAACRFLELDPDQTLGKPLSGLNTRIAAQLAAVPVETVEMLPYMGRRKLRCIHAKYLDRGHFKTYMFIDELTRELHETEKRAYEKLIRVISHEINNSLGATQSLLHSCLHYQEQIHEGDREDFITALEVAGSRINHLQSFVGDYVSVIKLPRPNTTATPLADLITHISNTMTPDLNSRDIQLTQKIDEGHKIQLDPNQMEQVLLNLIKNAAESVGKHGWIRIETVQEGRKTGLTITDNGPGIPEEIEDQLFTPFYTTKPDGNGIGLTLVAEILDNHGFDFSLVGPPGGPTRFTIWFT